MRETHRGMLDIRGPPNFSSFGPGPRATNFSTFAQARWYEYSRRPPQGLDDGVGRGNIHTYAIDICSARGAMTFLRAVRRAPYFSKVCMIRGVAESDGL